MEDQEKNNIQEAQVSEVDANKKVNLSVATDGLKSKNYHTEIILIFIIGLLLGIMVKAESLKKVSIGFSDYKLKGGAQEYNLDEIEKKMIEESKKKQESPEATGTAEGVPAESAQ
ncbi:MAG: hypothetical protein ACD_7C00429G0003 [uncultured bacterium]|nr:MAG: hypothetical protein ACD_7C00429G0003 [uncultured bacterium]KKP68044.1 MAG: hypothetical protein UR66_C0009G0134 [Candidatus Moranbacteria bacterium GW2011_GWE1_35_17]KKP70478.1 MAG: hypothetical protein UR65_C0040G0001 [Candidatus Moranbacteria bacterium GW2011_GWE2_35_164]KKP84966.1 MAG: hypothetical protein UR83_C0007G0012 [Candidatus Moranbacteria bacterium GW2011_GWF2_35_54]HBR79293.1 hypothetical protein [Candidatus Moranbacteria bacterium]